MDPLLTVAAPSDHGDFDFAAFLREDTADMDLDVAAPPSRSSAPSNSPTDSSPHAGPSSEMVRVTSSKARHERRGHTKSRRGCFNCKRRRIKVRLSYSWPGGAERRGES